MLKYSSGSFYTQYTHDACDYEQPEAASNVGNMLNTVCVPKLEHTFRIRTVLLDNTCIFAFYLNY